MLIQVINDDGPDWLVDVQTTDSEIQARGDAYCFCYEDPSPQITAVLTHTLVAKIVTLTDPKDAFRD